MVILVGIDLSLTSPGVAIQDTNTETWSLYGFVQRIRERGFKRQNGKTTIHLLPQIPSSSATNEERYEHIRHQIVDQILFPYRQESQVLIGIENYAFSAQSGYSYKLQELGGILKHSLWKSYPGWRLEAIPPAQWKKKVIGKGRASKMEAVVHVKQHGPCVSLLCELGLVVSPAGEVPCPAQDLADASCITLYLGANPCTFSPATNDRTSRKLPVTN